MGLEFRHILGQTELSEEEKEGLKISSITTQAELNELEQLNIENAVQWTIQKKLDPKKILTDKFIKDLHKRMYGSIWSWAGNFRRSEKNLGITWTQIPTSLKTLMDDAQFWIDNQTYSNEEIAIRFKHRIVSIHCFPNGNGRHSRLMADIIMESIFEEKIFPWNSSNMVKSDDVRKEYIKSLREADKGDFVPLISFARS